MSRLLNDAQSPAGTLAVAERLTAAPLPNTEAWFVCDGAEEDDHAGVLELPRRHRPDDIPDAVDQATMQRAVEFVSTAEGNGVSPR